MTSSGVRESNDNVKRTIRGLIMNEEQFIQTLRIFANTSSLVGLGSSGSEANNSPIEASGNFLQRAGDFWIGQKGNAFDTIAATNIVDDILNVSKTDGVTFPVVILQGESPPTADDLVTIVQGDDVFPFQELVIRTRSSIITIKNSDNINTPDGNDLVLPTGSIIHLFFDTFLGEWVVDGGTPFFGGGGNVPDGTAEFQHLQWSGTAWIAQQALAFGSNSSATAQLNMQNAQIGIAWRNAANDDDLSIRVSNLDKFIFRIGGTNDVLEISSTEIDVKTLDVVNVDRLLFDQSLGEILTAAQTGITSNATGGLTFNVPDQQQYFWLNNAQTIMQLDRDGTNNDTVLTLETDISNASAIPFFKLFRDDPTPAKDTEITNIQFIGRHAATDGGAAVGNASVYSQIVTEYESVITNREASSVNFFTSFDNGATSELKSFLGLNNENSNEITAFVDLNMGDKSILEINTLELEDTTTLGAILFNADGDRDTFISNNALDEDRIDVTVAGAQGIVFGFSTTKSIPSLSLTSGGSAFLNVTSNFVAFDPLTAPLDGIIVNGEGLVFFDDATDPAILKIKKKDSVGAVSIVSLEAGGSGPSFADNVFEIFDDSNNTKKLVFSLASMFANSTSIIASNTLTAGRTWSLPDITGTFLMNNGSQDISGIKNFTNSLKVGGDFEIVNTSSSVTSMVVAAGDILSFKEGTTEVGRYDGNTDEWTFKPAGDINLVPVIGSGGNIILDPDDEVRITQDLHFFNAGATVDFHAGESAPVGSPDGGIQVRVAGVTKIIPFFDP